MIRKRIMSFLVIAIFMISFIFYGCSSHDNHKSSSEPVDIEQFRCQDSIETVFDVLGKTEIITDDLEGERYEYDNLNLYGYDGKAVFKVRDDEDTISSFYCSFTLNEREFEDVLSLLECKYGDYEKSEYTNQIAYVWELPDSDAEEHGYNTISLSDYGDEKSIVKFSDEWSAFNDETYYNRNETSENEIETEEIPEEEPNEFVNDDVLNQLIADCNSISEYDIDQWRTGAHPFNSVMSCNGGVTLCK